MLVLFIYACVLVACDMQASEKLSGPTETIHESEK